MHQNYDDLPVWRATREYPHNLFKQASADIAFQCDATIMEEITQYSNMTEDEREECNAIQEYNALISCIYG